MMTNRQEEAKTKQKTSQDRSQGNGHTELIKHVHNIQALAADFYR